MPSEDCFSTSTGRSNQQNHDTSPISISFFTKKIQHFGTSRTMIHEEILQRQRILSIAASPSLGPLPSLEIHWKARWEAPPSTFPGGAPLLASLAAAQQVPPEKIDATKTAHIPQKPRNANRFSWFSHHYPKIIDMLTWFPSFCPILFSFSHVFLSFSHVFPCESQGLGFPQEPGAVFPESPSRRWAAPGRFLWPLAGRRPRKPWVSPWQPWGRKNIEKHGREIMIGSR